MTNRSEQEERLRDAAPILLELLKEASEHFKGQGWEKVHPNCICVACKIQRAIAEATGKSDERA